MRVRDMDDDDLQSSISRRRAILRISDLIVLAICVIAIFFYATKPLLSVGVELNFNGSVIDKLVSGGGLSLSADEDNASVFGAKTYEDSSSGGFNLDFSGINLDPIKLGVSIDSKMLIDYIKSDKSKATEFVTNNIITPNVNTLVANLKGPISQLVGEVVKSAAKSMLMDKLPDNLSAEDQAKLQTAVDNIYKAFAPEDGSQATVDSLASTIVGELDSFKDLEGVGELDEQEVKDALQDMMESMQLCDENGNISDPQQALNALLEMVLGGGEKEPEPAPKEEASIGTISLLGVKAKIYAEGDATATGSTDTSLEDKISNLIKDTVKIDPSMNKTISIVLLGVTAFWGLCMLTWFWLIFKMIFKFFAKNPGIKLWIPMFFGWFLEIFALIISLVQKVLKGESMLNKILPAQVSDMLSGFITGQVKDIMDMARIYLETSAFYAMCCAGVLFVMALLFYRRNRRKLKKALKEQKKRLKMARN